MSQFCIACGTENQDEAKFCKSCGQKLKTEESDRIEQEERIARETKLKEEKDFTIENKGQEVNFEVVEDKVIEHAFKFTPNEEASAKINKEFEETNE